MKIVVAAGTFDIIHLGHIHYLNHAKSLGEKLVVIIATDRLARRRGKNPMHTQQERLEMARNLAMVDEAVIGDEEDMLAPIRRIKPSTIYLGYDQDVPPALAQYCRENGIKLMRDKCTLDPARYKTSKIKERAIKEGDVEKLIALAKKTTVNCPWCRGIGSKQFLEELKSEIAELSQAFEKNDYENMSEEIGDVIWDAVVLAHICEREGRFAGSKVITSMLEKIERRKPWLVEGRTVSREEAERIWMDAKRREKQNRG